MLSFHASGGKSVIMNHGSLDVSSQYASKVHFSCLFLVLKRVPWLLQFVPGLLAKLEIGWKSCQQSGLNVPTTLFRMNGCHPNLLIRLNNHWTTMLHKDHGQKGRLPWCYQGYRVWPGLSNLNIRNHSLRQDCFSFPLKIVHATKDSPCNRNSTTVPAKAGVQDTYNQNSEAIGKSSGIEKPIVCLFREFVSKGS